MPEVNYPLQKESDQVILIKEGKHVLIDTGTPSSISSDPFFEWNGTVHDLPRGMMGMVDIDDTRQACG